MKKNAVEEEVCCPRFDQEKWNGKLFEWKDKNFVKDKVHTAFHMPIRFGAVMKKLDQKISEAGAEIEDNMCLSDHTSRWNMDVYLAVNRKIPGMKNVSLSGKFLSKVYEGDYKETEKWINDFEKYAVNKGYSIEDSYMWYTTCPKCAKKYGENYVTIIARVV